MPKQKGERALKQRNKYCGRNQNRSLGRWLVIFHTKPSVRNKLGNRGCTGESGFDPVELWVMGPPCGLKVERALAFCTVMIARHVRGQTVSYVGNNIGTKCEE